ncbi:MAG: diguanylate cyclase [Chloroflexi bacterium]|nr:diguanylate cyclase [Chloroflexota bacterium]
MEQGEAPPRPPTTGLLTALGGILLVAGGVTFVALGSSSGALRLVPEVFLAGALAAVLLGHAASRGHATKLEASLRQLRESLSGVAFSDALTQLGNRHYLDRQLAIEIARAVRGNTPLSILLVDVDKLKAVNDGWGHEMGDRLLRQVADVLRASIRVSDIATRYGGDEFLILAPEADKAGSLILAKRILEKAAASTLVAGGKQVPVSLSVGIASFPVDAQGAADLFSKADLALYKAKQRGGQAASIYSGAGRPGKKLLGEYLMELGICTSEQFEQALRHALESSSKGRDLHVGQALTELGFCTQEQLDHALATQARERAAGGSGSN